MNNRFLFISFLRGLIFACACSMYARGQDIIAEGKTKIIRQCPEDAALVIIESKDDITAGDGIKHDIILAKGALATITTSNVFRLLQTKGIPIAFKKQLDATKFLATYCTMIPYEVVVRREAHGSYLKRNPASCKGQRFPELIVEFFLKTNNYQWQGRHIAKNDPLVLLVDGKAHIYLPDVPLDEQQPCMILEDFPLHNNFALVEQIKSIAQKTFLILEQAWESVGGRLVDFKVEFGFDAHGNLLLADVIDNDSWRVIYNNEYIDKQIYRQGGNLSTVADLYQLVADLTSKF